MVKKRMYRMWWLGVFCALCSFGVLLYLNNRPANVLTGTYIPILGRYEACMAGGGRLLSGMGLPVAALQLHAATFRNDRANVTARIRALRSSERVLYAMRAPLQDRLSMLDYRIDLQAKLLRDGGALNGPELLYTQAGGAYPQAQVRGRWLREEIQRLGEDSMAIQKLCQQQVPQIINALEQHIQFLDKNRENIRRQFEGARYGWDARYELIGLHLSLAHLTEGPEQTTYEQAAADSLRTLLSHPDLTSNGLSLLLGAHHSAPYPASRDYKRTLCSEIADILEKDPGMSPEVRLRLSRFWILEGPTDMVLSGPHSSLTGMLVESSILGDGLVDNLDAALIWAMHQPTWDNAKNFEQLSGLVMETVKRQNPEAYAEKFVYQSAVVMKLWYLIRAKAFVEAQEFYEGTVLNTTLDKLEPSFHDHIDRARKVLESQSVI